MSADIDLPIKVSVRFDALANTVSGLPPGRERSLALTRLEEAEMWAKKAIEKGGAQ